MILCELTQAVTRLSGVGPAKAADLKRLGITTVRDLLVHLPRAYEDRTTHVPLAAARGDRPANTVATVIAHQFIGGAGKRTLKVVVEDETDRGSLVCFGRNFLERSLPPGRQIRLFGSFAVKYGELQATSFEFEPVEIPSRLFGIILPLYPLSGRLSQADIRRAVQHALREYAQNLAPELSPSIIQELGLTATPQALEAVHQPQSLSQAAEGRRSLAYHELLFLQLGIGLQAVSRREHSRPPVALPKKLLGQLQTALPFQLTDDQQSAVEQIVLDIEGPVPMARLLQGDVGSGKTVVALLSALPVVESGRQVVLMAPTELLARQHADGAARLFAKAQTDVHVGYLSSTVSGAQRTKLLQAIRTGEIDLVVGTHAVFTDAVRFRNLRYVIIDEQQRFGVSQRLALLQKGERPDLLSMTATPIPRTLAITVFGDLQITTIRTMPGGRKPIETHLARLENEQKVYQFVRRELEAGHQAYFVYPLIEESERIELRNAVSMGERLSREVFPQHRVAVVHSRVANEEKQATMEAFRTGEIAVLVATSVVEVGVDVPNATCMVIEHAERFGLAALHQLRGRVGRSRLQSYCFLIYASELTEVAKERLRALHETNDGFEIAEEDLRIRGPGDLTGEQQSGYLRFHAADLATDMELMNEARARAFSMLERDPQLLSPEFREAAAAISIAAGQGLHSPFAFAAERSSV